MGIAKNFFRKRFAKLHIKQTSKGCSIYISFESMGKRMDIAQSALDAQVWEDMQQYMPQDTGTLISETGLLNSEAHGEVYLYPQDSDYGHYQYEGIKYVDPEYNIGAFYNPEYGYWSRPGIEKIPSNEPLFYERETAEAHWDEVAYRNHIKDWVNVAKNSIGG